MEFVFLQFPQYSCSQSGCDPTLINMAVVVSLMDEGMITNSNLIKSHVKVHHNYTYEMATESRIWRNFNAHSRSRRVIIMTRVDYILLLKTLLPTFQKRLQSDELRRKDPEFIQAVGEVLQ